MASIVSAPLPEQFAARPNAWGQNKLQSNRRQSSPNEYEYECVCVWITGVHEKHSQLCEWMHLWGGRRERDSHSHSKSCLRVYVCNLQSQKLSRLLKSLARLTHTHTHSQADTYTSLTYRLHSSPSASLTFFPVWVTFYHLSWPLTRSSASTQLPFFGQQNILGLSQKWSKGNSIKFLAQFFSLDFKLLPAWLPGCPPICLSFSLYFTALRELPKLN